MAASTRLAPLIVGSLLLSAPLSAQRVEGRLLDGANDRPVPLAVVVLMTETGDSVSSDLTGSDGAFALDSPDPGNFVVLASAFGYRRTRVGVFELGEGGLITIEFRIRAEPLPLDELVVSLGRPVMPHKIVANGFVDRMQRGFGLFMTPKEIEESPGRLTSDLLLGLPGVSIGSQNINSYQGQSVLLRSSGRLCDPRVFVDGVRVDVSGPGSLDAVLSRSDCLGDRGL